MSLSCASTSRFILRLNDPICDDKSKRSAVSFPPHESDSSFYYAESTRQFRFGASILSNMLFIIMVVITVLSQTIADQKITQWSSLHCAGDLIGFENCATAFQSSIPNNHYTTTQGGLHARYGDCMTTVSRYKGLDIYKSLLSNTGVNAMQACSNPRNGSMFPGSVIIPNYSGVGQFNLTWRPA